MSPRILSSNLEALRKFRSVCGVVFSLGDEILFSEADVAVDNLADLAVTLDDISYYFEEENRNPDQLAFGYDGGNLVLVMNERYRLVVIHRIPEDVDLVARAARSFLKDYRMGLVAGRVAEESAAGTTQAGGDTPEAVDELLSPDEDGPASGQLAGKARPPVDPTQPIAPIV
ncbi:MAG: hypothetical protein WD342_11320 [Verrucomicrobiales bacterium]